MDKNGQNRGGHRLNHAYKPKANVSFGNASDPEVIAKAPAFFDQDQKEGEDFLARKVLEEITAWLAANDVLDKIPLHLLNMYATSLARWMQAEEKVNKNGFLMKHPTTGAPITSVFVNLALEFSKSAQGCWYQIYQIIKDATGDQVKVAEPTNSLLALIKKEA